ncbi:MAG: hypothetical protein E6I77_04860 [Chloroflexi bacterium]|nr:MAG: hypothetical protein E6I77_04860 [Chloroflexota bacterium]
MFLTDAPLVERRQVARDMWVLGFAAPDIAASVKAGQFVNIGMRPGPLLRRPFSVYRAGDDRIEVLLKAVGVGTAQMLAMREGDVASCLGPLGRGFDLPRSAKTVTLVSGGLGVAPMPLAARDARAAGLQVTWVHGARTADELCSETVAAAAQRWPQAQVAVETYMGCGTGVCLGCAVPLTRGGYDRACTEGPVYVASDVDWPALPSHLSYAVSA